MIEDGLPRLRPLFGVRPHTPATTCADIHPGGPLPADSRLICMGCHKAGDRVEAKIRAARLLQDAADAAAHRQRRAEFRRKLRGARKAARGFA